MAKQSTNSGVEGHWPADRVERWPIEKLVPYARNARTHGDAQVAQIAASIREWGWTNSVLVDEVGIIIAGHGRVLAAQKLGIGEVPVMVAAGWSDAQKRAYTLADNKLALNAGWDNELLALEVADLGELGFELDPHAGFFDLRDPDDPFARRPCDERVDHAGAGDEHPLVPARFWRRIVKICYYRPPTTGREAR